MRVRASRHRVDLSAVVFTFELGDPLGLEILLRRDFRQRLSGHNFILSPKSDTLLIPAGKSALLS